MSLRSPWLLWKLFEKNPPCQPSGLSCRSGSEHRAFQRGPEAASAWAHPVGAALAAPAGPTCWSRPGRSCLLQSLPTSSLPPGFWLGCLSLGSRLYPEGVKPPTGQE